MHLIYFDENKYSLTEPYFYIGGILLDKDKIQAYDIVLTQIQYNFYGTSILTKETELHGKDIFHRKGNCKKKRLWDRVQLLKDISNFIVNNRIPIRIVRINVPAHRKQYAYPEPEYRLGLMLFLERVCDFLDQQNKLGVVFGDYEKDEISRSVLDFSQFKLSGKTPMYGGRPLGRLIDTIYFTQSHHSRFLQLADIIIFLCNRFDMKDKASFTTWHETECFDVWEKIKGNTDFRMQTWF